MVAKILTAEHCPYVSNFIITLGAPLDINGHVIGLSKALVVLIGLCKLNFLYC